jgi:hypothetical protein
MTSQDHRPSEFDRITRMAIRHGFKVLDLNGAYDAIEDRTTLFVTSFDSHPNALGHKLLANRLEAEMRAKWLPSLQSSQSAPGQPTRSSNAKEKHVSE